jgi:hypothetical protein
MLELLAKIALFAFIAAVFTFVVKAFVKVARRDGRSDQERSALIQLAQERGWSYTPFVPAGADRYCGWAPFPGRGVGNGACDYTAGQFRGRAVSCFEYRMRTTGDVDTRSRTRIFAVFTVATPSPVPHLVIRRARKLDGVFARGRMRLGNPAFDEAFRVITDDEPFAREVLGGQLAQALPADARAVDGPVRFHGTELITWYEGRLRAQQVDARLDYLCDVLEHIPVQAWRPA